MQKDSYNNLNNSKNNTVVDTVRIMVKSVYPPLDSPVDFLWEHPNVLIN